MLQSKQDPLLSKSTLGRRRGDAVSSPTDRGRTLVAMCQNCSYIVSILHDPPLSFPLEPGERLLFIDALVNMHLL